MVNRKPYVAPKVTSHERKDDAPNRLGNVDLALRDGVTVQFPSRVAGDFTVLVDTDRRYIEVSDSFCQLVGYQREELIGRQFDDLTAPGTNDVPTVFRLFLNQGYMHGLWLLVHRTGTRILVRYEAWIQPDRHIQSNMDLLNPA